MNCINFRRREARDQIQLTAMSVEKLMVPVAGLRCGGDPSVTFSCPLSLVGTGGTRGTDSLGSSKLRYLVFLSLLASRELVYPFSWQEQGLATELNGSILKRWVWENFQMSGCLARWKVFMAQTHSQALWHTFSVTVAHWTYPTTPEKRVWGCLGCSMGRVAVPHPE